MCQVCQAWKGNTLSELLQLARTVDPSAPVQLWMQGQEVACEATSAVRPRYEPGDAVVFGDMLLILDRQYELPPKVEDREASIKSIHKVTLNDLCSAAHRLACPIEVSVEERGDEDFIACLYEAGLYGYGSTVPEALDDLRALLVDQYEHLVTREPRGVLGPVLRRQLRVLERFVERLSADD